MSDYKGPAFFLLLSVKRSLEEEIFYLNAWQTVKLQTLIKEKFHLPAFRANLYIKFCETGRASMEIKSIFIYLYTVTQIALHQKYMNIKY